MGALQVDSAVRREGDRLVATLSRDWEIRGPNGGYVSAVALRAAGAMAPGDHRPASLTVQYVGVADFGDVEAAVTPVRQGRNAWLLNVSLKQKDKVFLQAQVWTTNKAEGPVSQDAQPPKVPAPGALKTFGEHVRARYGADAPALHGFWTNLRVQAFGVATVRGAARGGPGHAQRVVQFRRLPARRRLPGFRPRGDPARHADLADPPSRAGRGSRTTSPPALT